MKAVAMTDEEVLVRLRAAILNGVYAPGQYLIEVEFAAEHGVGRIAVREAFHRLAADGLVELQPNRGARVRQIDLAEAIEITEVRRAIEGLIAARAAERIGDDQIAVLRGVGESMRRAVAAGRFREYSELNAEFHGQLRWIAAHDQATRVIDQLHAQIVRHQHALSLRPGRPTKSLSEHLAVIEAVCDRDVDGAERAMRMHLDTVIDALRRGGGPEARSTTAGEPDRVRASDQE